MIAVRAIRSAAVCALAFAPALAHAAPVAAASDATGTAAVLHPLELIKRRDLDFGWISAVGGAGTVTINPDTEAVTTTGGVQRLGGAPHSALFTGAAKSNSVVLIRIPKQPVTLTRVGGTETMTVTAWKVEGLDKRAAAAQVAFDFHVAGTLNVAANQADGLYVGSFDVTVQYP